MGADLKRLKRESTVVRPVAEGAIAEGASMAAQAPAASSVGAPAPVSRRWKWLALLATVVVGATIGGGLWWSRYRPGAPSAAASIAVLPFVNLSADKEHEYFSDGLTEELLSSLTKITACGWPAAPRRSSSRERTKIYA